MFKQLKLKADHYRIGIRFSCREGQNPTKYVNSLQREVLGYIQDHEYMSYEDFEVLANVETNHEEDHFQVIGLLCYVNEREVSGCTWYIKLDSEAQDCILRCYDELIRAVIHEKVWKVSVKKINQDFELKEMLESAVDLFHKEEHVDCMNILKKAEEKDESKMIAYWKARTHYLLQEYDDAGANYLSFLEWHEQIGKPIPHELKSIIDEELGTILILLGFKHYQRSIQHQDYDKVEMETKHEKVLELINWKDETIDSKLQEIIKNETECQISLAYFRKGIACLNSCNFIESIKRSRSNNYQWMIQGCVDIAINAFSVLHKVPPLCPLCHKSTCVEKFEILGPCEILMYHLNRSGKSFESQKIRLQKELKKTSLFVCKSCHQLSAELSSKFCELYFLSLKEPKKRYTYKSWLLQFVSLYLLKFILSSNLIACELTSQTGNTLSQFISDLRSQFLSPNKVLQMIYMVMSTEPLNQNFIDFKSIFNSGYDGISAKLGHFTFISYINRCRQTNPDISKQTGLRLTGSMRFRDSPHKSNVRFRDFLF